MLGAIAGDVIGSVHEGRPAPAKDFPLFVPGSTFTDDTVLTVAVASAIRSGEEFAPALRRWGRRYPDAGYGGWFRDWLARDDAGPYNSFGNGSASSLPRAGRARDPRRPSRRWPRATVPPRSRAPSLRGANGSEDVQCRT